MWKKKDNVSRTFFCWSLLDLCILYNVYKIKKNEANMQNNLHDHSTQTSAKMSEEETTSKAKSSSSGKDRFVVKKWNAVALWAWDIVVDNCAICRNHIMDLCTC